MSLIKLTTMPHQSRHPILKGVATALAVWWLGCGFGAAHAADGAAIAGASEPGAWHAQQVQFNYVGTTTFYSCSGIEAKLHTILQQLGAAPKPSVFGVCDLGSGYPSRIGGANIKFAALEPNSSAANPIMGHWQTVTFERNPHLNFDDGDCELFEQLSTTLFPLFSVKVLEKQFSCMPHDVLSHCYHIKLSVFVPDAPKAQH
jgi:hypothetical protein